MRILQCAVVRTNDFGSQTAIACGGSAPGHCKIAWQINHDRNKPASPRQRFSFTVLQYTHFIGRALFEANPRQRLRVMALKIANQAFAHLAPQLPRIG